MTKERALLDRAVDVMAALHRSIEPMENDPDLAGRVPPRAMREFVDALADIDRERCRLPAEPYCTCPDDYPSHLGHHPDCASQRSAIEPREVIHTVGIGYCDNCDCEHCQEIRSPARTGAEP